MRLERRGTGLVACVGVCVCAAGGGERCVPTDNTD